MKRTILMFLVIGATMIFFGCSENNPTAPDLSQSDQVTNSLAKKPLPKLIGNILCHFAGGDPYTWVGTVDFGDDVYGMRYKGLTGKVLGPDPVDDPKVYHFTEEFEIYLEDPEGPDIIYLSGSDFGVLAYSNLEGRMNGVVEVANHPFEDWLGRKVHMSGTLILEPPGPPGPPAFEGTIRIN